LIKKFSRIKVKKPSGWRVNKIYTKG